MRYRGRKGGFAVQIITHVHIYPLGFGKVSDKKQIAATIALAYVSIEKSVNKIGCTLNTTYRSL